jgi:ATP-dependent helicase/nuclease subunit B
MSGESPQVHTIPAGIAFADSLAAGLMVQAGDDPLALAAMTILLPTRRAARAVTDAFLRVSGGKALLLPRLLALAPASFPLRPIRPCALPKRWLI